MLAVNDLALISRIQAIARVLADGLQHGVTRFVAGGGALLEQTVIDEGGDPFHHVKWGMRLATAGGVRCAKADRFGGVQGEASDEDGETAEERLLAIVEQVIAPPNRVPHGLLAQGQVTRAATEQR